MVTETLLPPEKESYGLGILVVAGLFEVGWAIGLKITGGGRFEDRLPHSLRIQGFGIECWCLYLEKLIQVKRAAERPKDLEAIAELDKA